MASWAPWTSDSNIHALVAKPRTRVESALVVEICGRAGCWDEVVIGRTGYGGVARLHPSGRNPNDRRQTTTGRADGEGRRWRLSAQRRRKRAPDPDGN